MSGWLGRFRAYLAQRTGVSLDAEKLYFVESRLQPLAQAGGFGTPEQLFLRLEAAPNADLERRVLEAMLTNETFFFRDRFPFDHFRDVMLPRLIEQRGQKRHIRIWSAACASGQEAYSLAMILDEAARQLAGWRVEIFATDLSQAMLDAAREGLYTQFEVQRGLPINLLLRYFQREGDRWRIREHLRARVQFAPFNLLSDFSRLGSFDVVFCRNVLLYFEAAERSRVLARLARAVAPGGYLALGATEAVGAAGGLQVDPRRQSIAMRPLADEPRPGLRVVASAH